MACRGQTAGRPRGAHPAGRPGRGGGGCRVLPISLPTHPFVISSGSPYQQICKPSTLLISTESKYSNLEFSLFFFFFWKCDFNLPTFIFPSVSCFSPRPGRREINSTGVSDLVQARLVGGSPLPLAPKFLGFPAESGSPRHSLSCSLKDVVLTRKSQIVLHATRRQSREATLYVLCICKLYQCYC